MRKILLFPVILALCVAGGDAFSATPRSRTGAGNSGAAPAKTTGTKAARAGAKQGVVKPGAGNSGSAASTGTKAARAGAKQGVVKPGAGSAPATSTGTKAARAGAKQKVVNMGTKVAAATENTIVSQECQNAYYGCMDAFCMLDNASGGRCQCSDRNKDLNAVLDEIMKIDQQSLLLATEGVERIQMGESADEIMARVKAATSKVSTKDGMPDIPKEGESGTKVSTVAVKTLDLSAWKTNSLFDDDDDDEESEESKAEKAKAQMSGGDFSNKHGDDLQVAASELCAKQLPDQCVASYSLLQMTYGQRIRSDCTAYENGLKQQRAASQEKLQTAQKALRDAALEAFKNENKYDLGQCVVEAKKCLQTTAECGEDFSGCVADVATLESLYGNGNAKGKPATTAIKTGATSIVISSATYDIIVNKQKMCESVTKQCVNANKKGEVWKQVMISLAPTLYSAEYNAASNSRMNCINTTVECVQKVCKSQWDENSDNYDMCLSSPSTVLDNACKLQIERCGDKDTIASIKKYVTAKLQALRVDKCTQEVKECLLNEDHCGEDYINCIGLDTDSIVDLCHTDTLLACQSQFNNNQSKVRKYIVQVAQGLALNIDNSFATACQNAADAALDRVCGSAEDAYDYSSGDDDEEEGSATSVRMCPNVGMGNIQAFNKLLSNQFCNDEKCSDKLDEFFPETMALGATEYENKAYFENQIKTLQGIKVKLMGTIDTTLLNFDENGAAGVIGEDGKPDKNTGQYFYLASGATENEQEVLKTVLVAMNQKYASTISQIESDATVSKCLNGHDFSAISNRKQTNKTKGETRFGRKGEARFPYLTKTARNAIGAQLASEVVEAYEAKLKEVQNAGTASFEQKLQAKYTEIVEAFKKMVALKKAQLDGINSANCSAKFQEEALDSKCGRRDTTRIDPIYNSETSICTLKIKDWHCKRYNACSWWIRSKWWGCRSWGDPVERQEVIAMPTLDKNYELPQ